MNIPAVLDILEIRDEQRDKKIMPSTSSITSKLKLTIIQGLRVLGFEPRVCVTQTLPLALGISVHQGTDQVQRLGSKVCSWLDSRFSAQGYGGVWTKSVERCFSLSSSFHLLFQ